MAKFYIFLMVLVSYIASVQSSIWGDLSTAVTGDPYWFVGDDRNLTCNLSSEDLEKYTANDISFSYMNPFKADNELRCLPESNIFVIGNTKANLTIRNVTTNDAGQYTCYVGEKLCQKVEDIESLTIIGVSDDIKIEYRPHNVTKFQCLVDNWNSMNCTWHHPVQYVNWSNINVTVGYVRGRQQPVDASKCPQQSNHYCILNTEGFMFVPDYFFEVNVTNTQKNITATGIFYVKTLQSVKPAPIKMLSSQAAKDKQGCLILNWEDPNYWPKFYKILHQAAGEDQFQVLVKNLTSTTYTTCGYAPYTHHNFSVQSYPQPPYSGHWSDLVFTDVWTEMTAPLVGPSIANGSFTTSGCKSGLINVTVMWQEVEETARNGKIDSYLIKQGDDKELLNITADKHFAVIELPCDSQTALKLFAHNKGGYSLEPSVILIPNHSFTVPKSVQNSYSVEISKQSLRALWNTTEDSAESGNYTIFWCSGLPGQTCEDIINWKTVPGTQTEVNIPISVNEARSHLFGISVTNIESGKTSGIFWTRCLFTRSPDNVKSVDKMDVEGKVESVRIIWNPLQCSYQDGVKVTSYKLKYCEATHCNEPNDITVIDVPAHESSYTVSDLKANVVYNFTVQPESYGREGEEVVPWRTAKPSPPDKFNPQWLWLLIVPFSICIVWLIYKKCIAGKQRINKMINQKGILDLDRVPKQAARANAPEIPPARSKENLLGESIAAAACPNQTNQNGMPANRIAGVTGQVEDVSLESFVNDSSNNSRAQLIKPPSGKNHGKSCAHTIPEDNFELKDIPATKTHSVMLENTFVKTVSPLHYNVQQISLGNERYQTVKNGSSFSSSKQLDEVSDQAVSYSKLTAATSDQSHDDDVTNNFQEQITNYASSGFCNSPSENCVFLVEQGDGINSDHVEDNSEPQDAEVSESEQSLSVDSKKDSDTQHSDDYIPFMY